MTPLQRLSKFVPKYSTTVLTYFAFLLIACLPLFVGNILADSHSYIFGTHINYLHIRITLHFILAVLFLLYESRQFTFRDLIHKKWFVYLSIGTFALVFYSALRAYISAATYSQNPDTFAFASIVKLLASVLQYASVLLALYRITNATKDQHYKGSFLIFLSVLSQLLLGIAQVIIRGPLLPKLLSWTGQPLTFTSFSYLDTTILQRAYGTTPHPNILGGILVLLTIVTLSLHIPKFVKATITTLIGILIILTLSRAAIITTLLVLLIYFARYYLDTIKLKKLLHFPTNAILFFLANSSIYLGFYFVLKAEFTKSFIDSRALIQALYVELLTKNPTIAFLGTGFTQAIPTLLSRRFEFESSIYYLNRFLAEPPHNALLLTIVEFGFPIALGIWSILFLGISKAFQSQPMWFKLALLVAIVVLGGVDHYIVY